MAKKNLSKKSADCFICPGHNACAGCGQLSAVQAVMRGLSRDTIIVNATGCLEVTTTAFPQSAWGLPWIHSLFENAASVASGIRAALDQKKDKRTKVLVQAGDGGTFDIGFGLISGLWERGDEVIYICYDTEAYSNTGIQASGSTPYGASTTTTPTGSSQRKKDMISLALAHGLNYVAQSAAGFPDDITNKVKRALATKGPSYIQILAPCMPGWGIANNQAANMGKLAVKTGLFPLLEYANGQLVSSSIKADFQAQPVKKYLASQNRFRHLSQKDVSLIQKSAEENIKKYRL